jgi:hypothetical protein
MYSQLRTRSNMKKREDDMIEHNVPPTTHVLQVEFLRSQLISIDSIRVNPTQTRMCVETHCLESDRWQIVFNSETTWPDSNGIALGRKPTLVRTREKCLKPSLRKLTGNFLCKGKTSICHEHNYNSQVNR